MVVFEVVSDVIVLVFSLFIRFEGGLFDVEVFVILVFFLEFIEVKVLSIVFLTELNFFLASSLPLHLFLVFLRTNPLNLRLGQA